MQSTDDKLKVKVHSTTVASSARLEANYPLVIFQHNVVILVVASIAEITCLQD